MLMDYVEYLDGPQSVDKGKLGRSLHKGGSSGGGTSKTIAEPSKYVQPYLTPYMERADAVSNIPYEAYQGQRIANLSPEQYMGAGLTSAQALNGFQGQGDAFANYQGLMNGNFMSPDSNPWLMQNMNTAMDSITNAYRTGTKPTTDAAFARNGAFGGSAWGQTVSNNERQLADSLGATANQFLGQNYMNERGNQMQGLNMLPMLQNIGYTDAQRLSGVGDAFRQYQQDLLNTQYGDWQEAQNYPVKSLDVIGNAISRTMGGGGSQTSSTSGGYQPSQFASMLGGGIAGYGLTQSPYGAIAGGLGGLLL